LAAVQKSGGFWGDFGRSVLNVVDDAPVPSMVTPSALREALALPVPVYFGRNELSRTLRAQGLEAEYVECQLNHVQQGQDLLGRWSTLRVEEVGAALIPLLALGAEQEGWSVLSGLRAYPATPGTSARPQVTWVPGPLQRARDRVARRRALLACVLFEDAFLANALLAQLPRAARTQAYSCAGIAWIDLAENAYDPPATRRRFLTPITGLLVIRLRQAHAQRSSSFAVAIKAVVKHLLPGGSWEHLRAIAATGARYRLSGVEYGYALGELTAASLPVTALLQLLTGRMVTGSPVEPLPALPRRSRARTRPASVREQDYQRGLRYRAALRRQLYAVVAGQARLADPRRQLARFLDRVEPSARNNAPPVIAALIAWVRGLLEQGRVKDGLRLSAIRDYYLGLARFVYEAAWAVGDFAALDDDELEDIYSVALDYRSWKQRPATVELLRDFHTTLRRLYPRTPSIDFGAIEPRVKGRSVRSNLLTLQEYARTRQQIDLAERVALTCLYRLGLRPGELHRLGPDDIWLDGEPVLYIRSRRGGMTKTAAGQRQIPLTGRLTVEEVDEIGQLVARCRDAGAARLSSLMPPGGLARITTAMREASGDYTLVPYHLRHAARTQMLLWASTQPTASLPGTAPPAELMAGPEEYRRLHFAAEAPTRRSGYQEAVVAGHSSPATTYGTYMHALDWICHQAVLNDHPIDDAVLAQLSGFRPANVRQIRRRSGETVGGGQAVLGHMLKQGGLPAPPEWVDMIVFDGGAHQVSPGRQRVSSLLDVAEALRLSAGGGSSSPASHSASISRRRWSNDGSRPPSASAGKAAIRWQRWRSSRRSRASFWTSSGRPSRTCSVTRRRHLLSGGRPSRRCGVSATYTGWLCPTLPLSTRSAFGSVDYCGCPLRPAISACIRLKMPRMS